MDANSLHDKAEEAREKGEFLEALKLCDEATLAYQKEKNLVKLAEVQASRALTLRHLFEETSDRNFAILAKYAAKSGAMIAKENGGKGLAIPLYTLAKCYESLEDFEKSKEKLNEALGAIEGDGQARPSVVAEMKTRLAAVEYRLGDDSAGERFEAAYKELEVAEEGTYNKNVWLSGAQMHMAEAMITRGEKDKASEHISKAKVIIDSDDRLKLRKQQLERLTSQL